MPNPLERELDGSADGVTVRLLGIMEGPIGTSMNEAK